MYVYTYVHTYIYILIIFNLTGYSGDYSIGPYSVYVSAGVTSIPFGIGIRNDNNIERNEIFNIFIDPTSLPYNVFLPMILIALQLLYWMMIVSCIIYSN